MPMTIGGGVFLFMKGEESVCFIGKEDVVRSLAVGLKVLKLV